LPPHARAVEELPSTNCSCAPSSSIDRRFSCVIVLETRSLYREPEARADHCDRRASFPLDASINVLPSSDMRF